MTYTLAGLIGVVLVAGLDLAVLRTRLLRRKAFWTAYAIMLFFQVITNGVLTSRGVFRYDEEEILGWRILGAPVEDVLFGFCLITTTLAWWVWWGRRGVQRDAPRDGAPGRPARRPAPPPAADDAAAPRRAG